MRRPTLYVLLVALLVGIAASQDVQPTEPTLSGPKYVLKPRSTAALASMLSTYESPKRPGHYSIRDWRALIDSVWGAGPPTATKLEVFDTFSSTVNQYYGGFPYLKVNWDSLRALYRPEVEAGVSKGRLAAIMGQLQLSLLEIHTWIIDASLYPEFWLYGIWEYKPGIPIFIPSGWGWAGNFGAALTPLPDSTLLVYRAISSHPLGIVPGDIVLGYDGIPWKMSYKDLLSVPLPLQCWGEGRWGSSERSMTHALLNSAGSNWGLFDTIDVVKYSTGDTVHLPTALLSGLSWKSLFATEQVSVPGVTMPNYVGGEQVSWGVVDNTSVGYIYVYSWDYAVGPAFETAMRDLITVKKVTGLILDFRYNRGTLDNGGPETPNAGLDYLFQEDPAGPTRWRAALRSDPSNRFAFSYSSPPGSFSPRPDYYDRPIAVLTGPQTWSNGEITSFRMRFHPMIRFFGFPTNGAFVSYLTYAGPLWGMWYYMVATGQMQSLVNNEGFLTHKGFPVDEEVWLTRDGVAKGQDDVVKRALEWINSLSYAHDVQLSHPSRDTLRITARIQNPLAHTLKVTAILRDGAGALIDSLSLKDDGHHGDGAAGDSLWGYIYVPPGDASLHATVRTDDMTAGTSRTLPDAATILFTHGALIAVDTRAIDLGPISITTSPYNTTFLVRNIGFAPDSLTVSLDPYGVPDTAVSAFPKTFALAPGDSQEVTFSIRPSLLGPAYYWAQVIVESKHAVGQTKFQKNYEFQVVISSITDLVGLPTEFALGQNYPNPFNPSTTIRFGLPIRSHVSLTVFNTLGQQVALLQNGEQEAGYHEVKFDGNGLSSGVYFYRIQVRPLDSAIGCDSKSGAGDFVATKRLLLLK